MKHHITLKFLAFLLATVFLLTAIGSALGIIALIGTDLYALSVEEAYENQQSWERRQLALNLAHAYISEHLGHVPEEYYAQYYGYEWKNEFYLEDYYLYSIFNENGIMVRSNVPDQAPEARFHEIQLDHISYRYILSQEHSGNPQEPVIEDGYFDADGERYIQLRYQHESVSGYIVQLYILPGAYSYDAPWQILQALYGLRYTLFWVLGGALLLFVAVIVYLCCAAGRKPNSDTVRPGSLNRLPLDVYTLLAGALIFFSAWLGLHLGQELIYDMPKLLMYLLLLVGAVISLAVVSLIYAWAAQLKAPDLYWLKNSLVGRIFRLIGWCLRQVGRGIRWLFLAMHSLFRLLPVIWQWLLTAFLMVFVPLLFIIFANWARSRFWMDFWVFMVFAALFCDVFITVYGAYCFGTLLKGAKRMSHGDLRAKISTKFLLGSFRDFALQLNSLSDAIFLAAEQQTRSERMKTELITNVSHDIKTPLTSIINFVDLLQKPHTPEQGQEYLEVLSRQSAQMKKLIEDLMELSKANSGNISVTTQKMDAVEAVNQALGEFSDKLEAAGLTPVFRQPEQPVYMIADGRHVWRVLFNLLTNAVKYAMPGTRLYLDLSQAEHTVILSIKNISRTELNISADELLERFVQGDASRNTGGSGLGLNIAKSLMEVQDGQLQLLLDGDLFKVTLTFPAAE